MDFVTLILGLAKEVFLFLNTEESQKYIDESVDLQKQLQDELAKPLGQQNDSKIVFIHGRIGIISKAAQDQLAAKKASA